MWRKARTFQRRGWTKSWVHDFHRSTGSIHKWPGQEKYTERWMGEVNYVRARWSESWKAMSNSLWPHGLQPVRPLCPWNSSGQNTGVGSCSLRLGIFPTQGLNLGLPCCRWILYHLSHQGSPRTLEWVAYPFSRVSLPTQESNQSLLHWQDTAMKGFLFVCFVFNFSLSCKDL